MRRDKHTGCRALGYLGIKMGWQESTDGRSVLGGTKGQLNATRTGRHCCQ
jgi:hypothetical protein